MDEIVGGEEEIRVMKLNVPHRSRDEEATPPALLSVR